LISASALTAEKLLVSLRATVEDARRDAKSLLADAATGQDLWPSGSANIEN
jgi:hypothetical protein